MRPWRIILRNTEEKDDVFEDATHSDQCCLPVIKYKNFLSGSNTSIEISLHSTRYTSGLNLKLRALSLLKFTTYQKPFIQFNLPTSPNLTSIIPQIWKIPFSLLPVPTAGQFSLLPTTDVFCSLSCSSPHMTQSCLLSPIKVWSKEATPVWEAANS